MNLDRLALSLVFFAVILALMGGFLFLVGRIPFLGRLPGDFAIQRPGFSFYFPLATSIAISLILTIVLNLVLRIIGK